MDRAEIKHIVRDYVVAQFLPDEDPAAVGDDVRLVSEGVLDSLGSLRLVSFLEERFGIKVEAHEVDVDHLDTFDLIADMIVAKRG